MLIKIDLFIELFHRETDFKIFFLRSYTGEESITFNELSIVHPLPKLNFYRRYYIPMKSFKYKHFLIVYFKENFLYDEYNTLEERSYWNINHY